MAHPEEISALTKAFTGLGVDEKSLLSILTKWHPEQRQSYRKASGEFFKEDERQFEKLDEQNVLQLHQDFIRFKNAVVLRIMHPWERDARLFYEALHKGPQRKPQLNVLIETACTRSSEELLGARKAYHSLFDNSIEEDIASHILGIERKLLVALVSAYRYDGPHVHQETAKSEAKILCEVTKGATRMKDPVMDDEVIMILATRSKSHLKAVYKYYKEMTGKHLDEDIDAHEILKLTVQCLCTPQTYFSQVLDASLKINVDEIAKDAVTRVILTRADVDMMQIKEEYYNNFLVTLPETIEQVAKGNYRDFLLALVATEE